MESLFLYLYKEGVIISNKEKNSQITDGNGSIIPFQYFDEDLDRYIVIGNGDTTDVDFSKLTLLTDGNYKVIQNQYYDTDLGKFVVGVPPGFDNGGDSNGSVDWDDIQNKPQSYPPNDHDHDERYYTKEEIEEMDFSSGGEDFDGTVDWDNVTDKPANFPPSEHNHDDRYYTKDEINAPEFMSDRVDNITVALEGRELKVRNVDGLVIGVTDINDWLAGTEGNIQFQIDDLTETVTGIAGGMKFKDIAEDRAELDGWTNIENGDVAVVLKDETREDGRSMYVYSEDLGTWRYIGTFTFTTKFTALTDTPNDYQDGKYLKSTSSGIVYDDVDYQNLKNKPQSTITEIDDSVEKRHEHKNLDSLGMLGVNEQGILTINGVPYIPKIEKEFLSAYLGSSTTVREGNFIPFNITKGDSNIPYDSSTGIFTLTAGKTYRVTTSIMGSIPRFLNLGFANAETKSVSNPYVTVYGTQTITNRGSTGLLDTTFTIGGSSGTKFGILLTDAGTDNTTIDFLATGQC